MNRDEKSVRKVSESVYTAIADRGFQANVQVSLDRGMQMNNGNGEGDCGKFRCGNDAESTSDLHNHFQSKSSNENGRSH